VDRERAPCGKCVGVGGGACACIRIQGNRLAVAFVCDLARWKLILLFNAGPAGGSTSSERQGGVYTEKARVRQRGRAIQTEREARQGLRLEGPERPASSQFELSRLASRTPNAEADISCGQELPLGNQEPRPYRTHIAFLTFPGQGVRVRECGGVCACVPVRVCVRGRVAGQTKAKISDE